MNNGGIYIRYILAIGLGLILFLIFMGLSWAGQWDYNPDQEAVKYKNDVTSDVTGEGYFKEYKKVNTNNLSMLEYSHGSGNLDFERITAACKAAGTKHVLVEQDICQGDPLEALRQSFIYLSQLDLA